jgi:hypothetical protein
MTWPKEAEKELKFTLFAAFDRSLLKICPMSAFGGHEDVVEAIVEKEKDRAKGETKANEADSSSHFTRVNHFLCSSRISTRH